MRKIYLMLFLLVTIKGYAQLNVPTPNAEAMSIFGQYPQSSFTGVPPINIPIQLWRDSPAYKSEL